MILEAVYGSDCRSLIAENRSLLKNISEEIFALTEDDEKLSEALKNLIASPAIESVDDDGEDTDPEEDDTANRTINAIRTWFRRYCYAQIDKSIKLTPRQQNMTELLVPVLIHTTATGIGSLRVDSCCSSGVTRITVRSAVYRLRTRVTVSRTRTRSSALAWPSTESRKS